MSVGLDEDADAARHQILPSHFFRRLRSERADGFAHHHPVVSDIAEGARAADVLFVWPLCLQRNAPDPPKLEHDSLANDSQLFPHRHGVGVTKLKLGLDAEQLQASNEF